MRSEDGRAVVSAVLAELGEWGSGTSEAGVAELRRRLEQDRFRVLVVGEAKRGKSTFVNALLRRDVLPTGVTPLTAITTSVGYGDPEEVRVRLPGGREESRPLDALVELVTESGNPHNRLGLQRVEVRLNEPLLAAGVELVDTPGTGSVYEHNTSDAEAALLAMDAAVFVLSADPPISAAERGLLHRVTAASVATFVLVNKADRLEEAERAEARAFTETVVREAVGRELPIRFCAARHGPEDAGFAAFEQEFRKYLQDDRASGLVESIRRQAGEVVDQLLDEVLTTRRADALRESDDAERVERFRDTVDALARKQRDAVDLVHGEGKRLLRELNEKAERVTRKVGGVVAAQMEPSLADAFERSVPAVIEKEGLRRAAALITDYVEPWRAEQAERFQQAIDALDTRLLTELDAALAAIRPAARELLGVELSVPPHGQRLATDPRFFYHYSTGIDITSVMAMAVRRRLPGALGRRRAVQHVRSDVASLGPRQVGRARADLQQRLAETERQFVSALSGRYGGYADRLQEALRAAQRMSELGAGEREGAQCELAEREAALRRLADTVAAAAESSKDPLSGGVPTGFG